MIDKAHDLEKAATQGKSQPAPAGGVVLVFRKAFLPPSETFIEDHLRSLSRYESVTACEFFTGGKTSGATRLEGGRLGRWLRTRIGLSPRLSQMVKHHKVGLVHAHFLTDATEILAFCKRRKIPLIVTAHGYDATTNDTAFALTSEGRRYLRSRTALNDYAAKIIAVSDGIKQAVLDRGFTPSKITTQPLGVDIPRIRSFTTPATARRGIVTVGRLVEKKGTRFVIEAAARAQAALNGAPLTVVGDGPLRSELEALAIRLGANVKFAGALGHAETLKIIAASEVFVFPSIAAANGDAEGMGIAPIEAMALGIPTVVFDKQPIAEILERENCGLVVPSKGVDALAKAIESILMDKEFGTSLSDRALQVTNDIFSLQNNTKHLEVIYDSIQI